MLGPVERCGHARRCDAPDAPISSTEVRLARTTRLRLAGRPGVGLDAGRGLPDDVRRLALVDDLGELDARVSVCSACPRLVAWREQVAQRSGRRSPTSRTGAGRSRAGATKRPAVLIVGLAPAANGGNRTGRVFTGDSSGDWLFASPAPGRAGRAADPRRTRGTASGCSAPGWSRPCGARRRLNKPTTPSGTPASRGSARRSRWCADSLRVVVALGGFGWPAPSTRWPTAGYVVPRPRPSTATAPGRLAGPDGAASPLLGCYHPSQQNTFTGRLTPAMLDDVLGRARVVPPLTSHTIWSPGRPTSYDVPRGPRIPTGRGSRLKSDPVWVRTPAGAPRSGYSSSMGWWPPPCPCCTNGP